MDMTISAEKPWANVPRGDTTRSAIGGRKHGALDTHRSALHERVYKTMMRMIRESDTRGVTPTEIVQATGVDVHTVSRMANRMGYPVCQDDAGRFFWADNLQEVEDE